MMKTMTATAFIFPGLNGLMRRSDRLRFIDQPQVVGYFRRAEKILRDDFGRELNYQEFLKQEADEIYRVENVNIAAVAIVAIQCGVAEALFEKYGEPEWMMGCSLGDLARTILSGAYKFEDAIFNHLTYSNATDGMEKVGLNLAILTSSDQPFKESELNWFTDMKIDVSVLSPRFLNIGCRYEDLEAVKIYARERKWNSKVVLDYPAHSRYILPFIEKVEQNILRINIQPPQRKLFSSLSARPVSDTQIIKEEFIYSLARPIHWSKAVQSLVTEFGVEKMINIGPCRSLSLIVRDVPVDVEMLESTELLQIK